MLVMKGGQLTGRLSEHTIAIVRRGALIFAILHVIYGLAASVDWIQERDDLPLVGAALLGAAWLALAWWQYRDRGLTLGRNLLQLAMYYVLSGIYLVFIIEPDSAFVILWALLITTTSIQLGWLGFSAGALVFISLITVTALGGSYQPAQLAEIAVPVAVTLFLAYLITLTIRQAMRDQRELDKSHAQVALQRDRTETLVNNLADAVISTNSHGTITLYNAATLSLLDTNTSLEGKNIDEVLQLSDSDNQHFSLSDSLAETRSATVRDDLRTISTGESTRLEITYAPIRSLYSESTEDTGFVMILRDITKSKSLEEERDEFISVVSHELRTPITIAEGTVSNAQIMMGRDDIAPEKISDAIDMAHDQIVYLAKMVNDLSTLSRAERGVGDEAEVIDINELVSDLYRDYQSEAEDKGLALDLRVPTKVGSVYVSRLYLRELMQNFITNAIKYTNRGSVTIEVTTDKKDHVTLAVRDTGVGISKADQRRIFDRFYRSEDYRTRETSGTGLGLYVATKLANKLRTHIVISSRLNHGSTFSISLPLHKPDKPKASESID